MKTKTTDVKAKDMRCSNCNCADCRCTCKKDLVMFFAGFEFFHTMSHIIAYYIIQFPIETSIMTYTSQMNVWGIVVNGLVTVALLWWAKKLMDSCKCS